MNNSCKNDGLEMCQSARPNYYFRTTTSHFLLFPHQCRALYFLNRALIFEVLYGKFRNKICDVYQDGPCQQPKYHLQVHNQISFIKLINMCFFIHFGLDNLCVVDRAPCINNVNNHEWNHQRHITHHRQCVMT